MFQDVSRLFSSPSRIKLLKFFVLQPDMRASVKSVSAVVGIPPGLTEKELRHLSHARILSHRKNGSGTVFSLNRSYALIEPLARFLETTTTPPVRSLTQVFKNVRGVSGVVATGILLNEPRSSLDLLIIAPRRQSYEQNIARAVRKIERLIALPLRYAVLERKEYEERFEARDRLLRDIFEFEHVILIGGPGLRR